MYFVSPITLVEGFFSPSSLYFFDTQVNLSYHSYGYFFFLNKLKFKRFHLKITP